MMITIRCLCIFLWWWQFLIVVGYLVVAANDDIFTAHTHTHYTQTARKLRWSKSEASIFLLARLRYVKMYFVVLCCVIFTIYVYTMMLVWMCDFLFHRTLLEGQCRCDHDFSNNNKNSIYILCVYNAPVWLKVASLICCCICFFYH